MGTFLTPEQVAERLAVTPRTIKDLIRRGELTGVKVGKYWRINEDDLTSFIASHTTRVNPQSPLPTEHSGE